MKDNKYNILDSMAGDKGLKENLKTKAYETSNDLKRIGGINSIAEISKIEEIYKATDFALMKDPFKYQNLDMKVNPTKESEDLVICIVKTEAGTEMAFMINLSETNGLNKGDILRIDLDKEGKENQTTWSDDFEEHLERSLGNTVSAKAILEELKLNNYEDIIREVNKKDGFQMDKKEVVKGINEKNGVTKKSENREKEEDEEINIEEAAAQAGVSVDAIQKFCEKNGIAHITGISFTSDTQNLSEKLDYELPETENLIMVRASGINGKANSAFVIDQEGETLFKPGDTPNGENFLLDVVKEGASGNEIEDVTEAAEETNKVKIGESSSGISVETSEIEGKNISDNLRFELEEEIKQLMEKLDNEIDVISHGAESPLEKAKLIEQACLATHTEGMRIQEKYNVVLPGLTEKTTEIANAAVAETEKEEIKEVLGTVGEAAIGAFAAVAGLNKITNSGPAKNEDDGHDPREAKHTRERN